MLFSLSLSSYFHLNFIRTFCLSWCSVGTRNLRYLITHLLYCLVSFFTPFFANTFMCFTFVFHSCKLLHLNTPYSSYSLALNTCGFSSSHDIFSISLSLCMIHSLLCHISSVFQLKYKHYYNIITTYALCKLERVHVSSPTISYGVSFYASFLANSLHVPTLLCFNIYNFLLVVNFLHTKLNTNTSRMPFASRHGTSSANLLPMC